MLTEEKGTSLIEMIKERLSHKNFAEAEREIAEAMAQSPHDAAPHNLMGILLEHKGDHPLAMKHFRAAWALDPTFRPARFNIHKYGCSGSERFQPDAYEDSDCPDESRKRKPYKIEYGGSGIGLAVRR